MITHGTPGDWIVWSFLLVVGIITSAGSFHMARLCLFSGERVPFAIYSGFMMAFLILTFCVFITAPFHVSITSG